MVNLPVALRPPERVFHPPPQLVRRARAVARRQLRAVAPAQLHQRWRGRRAAREQPAVALRPRADAGLPRARAGVRAPRRHRDLRRGAPRRRAAHHDDPHLRRRQ